jgi:putative colanic acid biosynthesis UDP-glucose lipid carrier transferase
MLAVDDYYKPKIGRYSLRSMVSPELQVCTGKRFKRRFGDVEVEMKKELWQMHLCKKLEFCSGFGHYIKNNFIVIAGDKNAK